MSSVNILNIIPKNILCHFTDPFAFEIIFEVLSPLENALEWKMIYIGNAEDSSFDQTLEIIEIDGPLNLGTMKFEFIGEAPDIKKIPESEVLGVTAIVLCCSYNGQEFFRCGYYLNNSYDNEKMNLSPPERIMVEHIIRSVLADKPRITRFDVDWDNNKNLNNNNDDVNNNIIKNNEEETNNNLGEEEEGKSEEEKMDSINKDKDTTNEGSIGEYRGK